MTNTCEDFPCCGHQDRDGIFCPPEDPRDSVIINEGDEGVMWFVNEDGSAYPYPANRQRADYPNDDHTPFRTAQEALDANVWEISPCGEVGCGDCAVCIPDDIGWSASYNPTTGQWDYFV